MPDRIVDSKYRVLDSLPRTGGRERFLVSDLISGRMAVLETVALDGFERLQKRWSQDWQPVLRERVARFAKLPSMIPVTAVGALESGPYYVFEIEDEDSLQGRALEQIPSREQLQRLLVDVANANATGDHVLNLRPESLCLHRDALRILPAAYILPLELLARAGTRSPFQPPELRHAGHLNQTTDGFIVAGVLQASAERLTGPRPEWWRCVPRMQTLEPWARLPLTDALAGLANPGAPAGTEALNDTPARRSIDRLLDLDTAALPEADRWQPVLAALDTALVQMSDGASTVLCVEAIGQSSALAELFLVLRECLALLTERPFVVRVDAFTSWEMRDLSGRGATVVLVPDFSPAEVALLPLESLLGQEKLRPAVWIVGARRSSFTLADAEAASVSEWLRQRTDASFVHCVLDREAGDPPAQPVSAAARHLLDLLSVFDVDAPGEMLRLALPQQEHELPQALAEMESLGHVRRVLEAGGWWGTEPQVVLRSRRPDVRELRCGGLTVHRREELHLLLSHLLADVGAHTLPQRLMRFEHLFAGGSWDGAAAECGPLLQGVQRRGLEQLLRQLQRKIVNSNLAHHLKVPQLLEVLHSLGRWEVERNHLSEGRSYFERAAEKLFALPETDVAHLDLNGTSEMLLAHAELLERHGDFEHSLELLQRYLERFGERIPAVERGRLFTEMAYSEFRLGRFSAAEERCQPALKLLDARRHQQEVAKVHNILGLVRWRTSRYEEAEHYLASSLALREKSGDLLAVARAYNNLGLLERTRRRFPEALEYHRKSMEIRQELGDPAGVARDLLNLAWVYFEMQDLARAEELAQRSCTASIELDSRTTCAAAKGLLGAVYLAQDRRSEARSALADAVQMAREVSHVAELFMDLRKQATLELRDGNLPLAEALLQESEQYMTQAGSPLEEANWYRTHGELRAAQGDIRGAALSYEHAGNNLARLADAQAAAGVFLLAAQLYHQGGVAGRARELVVRGRQLYERDGAVVPKALVDLEVEVGEGDRTTPGVADGARAVDMLLRACASAASIGGEVQALEQILLEMKNCAGASCAVLVRPDGEPHRASVLGRHLQEQGLRVAEWLRARPRLLARAQQTVLPLGSDDLRDEESGGPFYIVPVEAFERRLGCVLLEWPEGTNLPDASVLHVLRSMVHLVALVLERGAEAAAREVKRPEAPARREETSLDHIIGKSGKRQALVEFIRQVRDLQETVLLLGENGTGKEVVAKAIHFTGERRSQPLVTMNCTAVPTGLWERELFGHERGAFTDAHETKRGYFETAHRGTLLLDEIGDMPWDMQTRFLRVLEEKAFMRIGGTERIQVDVRIIAATNQDLEAAVRTGRFRRDLYHRLNVLAITLPPLRDRREDIPELAQYFLDQAARNLNTRSKRLSGEALRVLLQYPWLGNVRELENFMTRSLVLSPREVLAPEDLPAEILKGADAVEIAGTLDLDQVARWVLDHASYSASTPLLDRLEREIARQLVERIGAVAQAARLLGLSRPTMYAKLRQ